VKAAGVNVAKADAGNNNKKGKKDKPNPN